WSADCNSDGVVDYGQIRAGELDDANGNNIPDCCEQGTPCACPADIDANGAVNGIDLAIILNKWGTDGGKDYPNADQNKDGTVNAADLAAVLNGWGPCS
ncbi:MAG: dockerin type I domain-containing protein, partial [Phycisphaerales bacterium]